MKFVNISRDPNGIYIGYISSGVLYYYKPMLAAWVPLRLEDYGVVLQ